MPTIKEKVFIAASAGLLATGFATALQPPSPNQTDDDRTRNHVQRDVGDLADQQDAVHEQLREDGNAAGDAHYQQS